MAIISSIVSELSISNLTFGQNELGGKLGFITTLHTRDKKLGAHFHLHCLDAGGAVSSNGSTWLLCKGNYLFSQRALSLVFRGKFMEYMFAEHSNVATRLDL